MARVVRRIYLACPSKPHPLDRSILRVGFPKFAALTVAELAGAISAVFDPEAPFYGVYSVDTGGNIKPEGVLDHEGAGVWASGALAGAAPDGNLAVAMRQAAEQCLAQQRFSILKN